jgi:predicted acyltransferase
VAPIVILQTIALLELLASSQVRHLRLDGCLREAVLYAHYIVVWDFFRDGENFFCLLEEFAF